MASGALPYLVFAGIGGFVGYCFAKKRTEHEVDYRRRVEVVERIQSLVVSLAEEFEAALGYIREPVFIDERERHYVQQEVWLDGETLARFCSLAWRTVRLNGILPGPFGTFG